ncbi:hypothetical protein MTBUT4_200011 [Magnetospirillum sp. UT-4]|nr:hypothetical protein MTBUT4_200011 [Magnetospirillum sp. UT-4]
MGRPVHGTMGLATGAPGKIVYSERHAQPEQNMSHSVTPGR